MDNNKIQQQKNKKELIVDSFGSGKFRKNIISEAVYKDDKFVHGMIVEGILQRANAINQNGRKYPKRILEREANNYVKTFVTERRSFGELDHPATSVVSMQTASHWIQKLWWSGDDLYGRIELLDTPCGRIVEAVLKRGLTIGISSRGLGSVKPLHEEDDDQVEVQDDFEILSWDFVSNPSTINAFMYPVKEQINEGFVKTSTGLLVPYKYDRVNTLISEILIDLN
jgi:hypothetical protein